MKKQIGQTKEVGFQFGIRKTFPVTNEKIWDFLFSQRGLKLWLGELQSELELKKEFLTKSGIKGVVRVLKPASHIRLNWQKENWTNISTLQLRVIKNKEKTTLSFHHEKLIDSQQREEVKAYWNNILDKITEELKKEASH